MNNLATVQFGEMPAVRLFPLHSTIAQHHVGELGGPGREFGFGVAVLPIDRGKLPGVLQRLTRKILVMV